MEKQVPTEGHYNRETPDERAAFREAHRARKEELAVEQRALLKTLRDLDKELKHVSRRLRDASLPHPHVDAQRASSKMHDMIRGVYDTQSNNAEEMSILKDLLSNEQLGSDLKKFLSNPGNLTLIALILAMTPGTGYSIDLLRHGNEAITQLFFAAGTGLLGIGAGLYRLVQNFGESQRAVQEEINSLREELQDWQSSSST